MTESRFAVRGLAGPPIPLPELATRDPRAREPARISNNHSLIVKRLNEVKHLLVLSHHYLQEPS